VISLQKLQLWLSLLSSSFPELQIAVGMSQLWKLESISNERLLKVINKNRETSFQRQHQRIAAYMSSQCMHGAEHVLELCLIR